MLLNWVEFQAEVSAISIWKAYIWFLSKEEIGGVVRDASGRLLHEVDWRWWCCGLRWWRWRGMEKKQFSLRRILKAEASQYSNWPEARAEGVWEPRITSAFPAGGTELMVIVYWEKTFWREKKQRYLGKDHEFRFSHTESQVAGDASAGLQLSGLHEA